MARIFRHPIDRFHLKAVSKSVLLVLLTTPIFVFLSGSEAFAKNWNCEWAYYHTNGKPAEPIKNKDGKDGATFYFTSFQHSDPEIAGAICIECAGRALLKSKKSEVIIWLESDDPNDAPMGYKRMTYFDANIGYGSTKSKLPPLKISKE